VVSDEVDLGNLIKGFLDAVSFTEGDRPHYHQLRDLFSSGAQLVKNSGPVPEISTVESFITPRQMQVDDGSLSAFEEVEIAQRTELFGNVAHRFSTYTKNGVVDGHPFDAVGVISTQFIRTPEGWRISAMAWDDERPGRAVPDRYR
jgi:hypothetical protein